VIAAGSIALLAFVFGDYCTRLFPLGEHSPAVYAALLVAALTGVNIVGIRAGKRTQNWLTVCEVGGLVIVVIAGLFLAPATAPAQAAVADRPWYAGIGLSMIFVLLTYGGWNEAAYVSAEVKDRNRNIIRSLLLSLGVVTVLYVLVNIAYLRGLGMAAMSKSDVVAADLLARVWGENGARLISLIIAVSTLTSVNATIIVGARSNFALGREWPLFSFLARWDSASGAPRNSYVFQAAIALGLILLGALTRRNFETMVDYTAPVFWAFFLLVGLSLFVLRTHEPGRERPFRVPFFPVTPLVFVLSCFYLLYSSLAYTGVGALVGVGVLATGAVVMLFGRQRARA
jgi:amino acid transporter